MFAELNLDTKRQQCYCHDHLLTLIHDLAPGQIGFLQSIDAGNVNVFSASST